LFNGFRIGCVPQFKEDFARSILLLASVLMKLFNAKDFVVADENHPTGCRHFVIEIKFEIERGT
jgi:hypothetical protein